MIELFKEDSYNAIFYNLLLHGVQGICNIREREDMNKVILNQLVNTQSIIPEQKYLFEKYIYFLTKLYY